MKLALSINMVNNRLFSLAGGLLGGSFLLMAGSVAAQALTLLISPVLTRIYAPEDMGVYALYTSAIAILTLVSTVRYDMAIISPKRDKTARILVKLILLVSVSMFALSVAALLAFALFSLATAVTPAVVVWLWLVPAGVFLAALQASYTAYLLRNKQYGAIATVRLLSAASAAGLSVTFGWLHFGVWGLLLSSLGALLIGVLLVRRASHLEWWPTLSRRRLLAAAKRYINYPRIDLPSSLLGVIGSQLPTILLGVFFGPAFLGFYALADRILLAPLSTLGGAVGSVFRVRATEHAATMGGFSQEYSRTFVLLLVPAIVFFVPVMIFGEDIFVVIFGARWRTAGQIAQTLSPLYFVRLLASPLSMSFYVRNRMKVDLVGQILFAVSSLASTTIGWLLVDPWVALKLLVLGNGTIYTCYLIYGWRIATDSYDRVSLTKSHTACRRVGAAIPTPKISESE